MISLKSKNILVRSKNDFEKVAKLILPGVGSFDSAMDLLSKNNCKDSINSMVLKRKKYLEYVLACKLLQKIVTKGSKKGF